MNEQTVLELDDAWLPLPDGERLTVTIPVDDITVNAVEPFDLTWDGTTSFTPLRLPTQMPTDYALGVIVGASGSGKSTLLREFGTTDSPAWGPGSIASHFPDAHTAAERFYSVGLNAVPTWTKPYRVLSNGERFRADLARQLGDDATIDEFTSVVDRNVAIAVSRAIRRSINERRLHGVVLATCHRDILPWLEPDWVIDTDIRCWALRPRECLQQPELVVEVYAGASSAWDIFGRHHYLAPELSSAAECFVATMNDELVGFSAVLSFPNGNLRHAFREHRTVILPDFQGLGIGMRLSDWVGECMIQRGRRYFSRTAHPRMGAYRDASPLWRPTSSSRKQARKLTSYMSDEYLDRRDRKIGGTVWAKWDFDDQRVGWSHEYVGLNPVDHPPIVHDVPLTLGLP